MNRKRILLIDGHNLLYQMYFGMPARILGSGGLAVHAVIGFTGAIIKTLDKLKPSHVLVIFDGEQPNSRAELNSEYKANRENTSDDAENMFRQFDVIKSVLDYMEIRHFETKDGLESDDYISGYTKKYSHDFDIFIMSQDSDLFCLADENVRVFRYRGKSSDIVDADFIINKYGIIPEKLLDFKALSGDSSDNVRGISKVGAITAAKIINNFGSAEEILNQIANNREEFLGIMKSLKISRLAVENILDSKETITNNINIIRLREPEKLPFEISELAYENKTTYKTIDVLKELGIM